MRVWSIAFAGLLGSVTPASALCVSGIPLCQTFWGYDTVFEGTVVGVEQRPGVKTAGREDLTRPPNALRHPHKVVTFEVIRSFRGERGPRVQLIMPGGAGWWVEDSIEFASGRRYLVFGWRVKDGNYLTATACGPGGPVPSKEASDAFAFLETLSQPSTGGRVYGDVFNEITRVPNQPLRPSVETDIVLEGEGVRRVERSKGGSFEFTRLQPGRYTLTITLPSGFTGRNTAVIDIPDPRACAQYQFFLRSAGD